jgi:hypothetical protein
MEVVMRSMRLLAGTAALSAMVVTGVAAQTIPMEVEVTPLVGGMLFLTDLPREFEMTGADGAVRMSGLELNDAAAFGGRAGLRFADRFGVGATVLYSPTTATASTGTETDVGVWSYGLDLSYHASSPSPLARPFLVGGVGAKTYDFDGLDARSHFMWNVGAGVDVALHPKASLRLEARDYMSLFASEIAGIDDELQHDLALSAGLSFRLGGR